MSPILAELAMSKGFGRLFPRKGTFSPIDKRGTDNVAQTAGSSDGSRAVNKIKSAASQTTPPDLRDLNDALRALAEIFPDIQLEVFREMLTSFGEESRLHVVTDSLLKQKATHVRGRVRVPPTHRANSHRATKDGNARPPRSRRVPRVEEFRSDVYKAVVYTKLSQEFKGLSQFTILAILAERNYSYTNARPVLLDMTLKSWTYSVVSFFTRQKRPSAANHPLLSWRKFNKDSNGPLLPKVIPTGSAELDEELHETLCAPLLARYEAERIQRDKALAESLNVTEAEDVGALFDCECCFTATTFEQIAACDDRCHYICYRCIRHSLSEALYGQGWARNIEPEKSTLRCIAPAMNEQDECRGCIPQDLVKRAVLDDGLAGGADVWRQLESRVAGESVLKSQLPLLKCPFCVYAEVDDIILPQGFRGWKVRLEAVVFLLILYLSLHFFDTPHLFSSILAFSAVLVAPFTFSPYLRHHLLQSMLHSRTRISRKRRGLRFECRNPLCGRASCISCAKEWHDIHVCYESERQALRSAVERAMAEAVKRTCPNCNMSFIKSSGCNKLTCVCGYQMCYLCRNEIGRESYGHFCQHFRPNPGIACAECDRCDLYKAEDEDVAIQKAAEQAEREWKLKAGIETKWGWQDSRHALVRKSRAYDSVGLVEWLLGEGELGSWQDLLDYAVETLFL